MREPASKPMWGPRTFTVGWWVCRFWMGLDMYSTWVPCRVGSIV